VIWFNIEKTASGAMACGVELDTDSLVSMNMWGLSPDFIDMLEDGFKEFFDREMEKDPLGAEYLIPTFIGELLNKGRISVKVLRTDDTWYGMTYREDVALVRKSFRALIDDGIYSPALW